VRSVKFWQSRVFLKLDESSKFCRSRLRRNAFTLPFLSRDLKNLGSRVLLQKKPRLLNFTYQTQRVIIGGFYFRGRYNVLCSGGRFIAFSWTKNGVLQVVNFLFFFKHLRNNVTVTIKRFLKLQFDFEVEVIHFTSLHLKSVTLFAIIYFHEF
jgi:hypothetical protein